jgi:hypothetical protein
MLFSTVTRTLAFVSPVILINSFSFFAYLSHAAPLSIYSVECECYPARMKSQRSPNKFKVHRADVCGLVNELPEGKNWLYAAKFGGYRCLAGGMLRDNQVTTI